MKPALHIVIPFMTALIGFSWSCSRKGTETAPEYYSGMFLIDESGRVSFTDCATRVGMVIDSEGSYERVRRAYGNNDNREGGPVRIEFYGKIVKQEEASATGLEVRVDSLLSLNRDQECLSEYIVAGFYRRVHDGEAEILRMRPDYSYSIENFSDGDNTPLSEGRWYRTSEMTLELRPSTGSDAVPFQIIPARESLAGTGGGDAVVYKKEWL